MPIFQLQNKSVFPPANLADKSGLLAVGGDLSVERLLRAYTMGIFPWYCDDDPILWWSPDPRLVLFPNEMKISRSLRQVINNGTFHVTFDEAFETVINECAVVHKKEDGDTWISDGMISAYIELHKSGFAHSVEAWFNGAIAGGLYGVSLGTVFFGESMFTKMSNSSKVAFATLVQTLNHWNFSIIDCQITSHHLRSFGAREIPRKEFLKILNDSLLNESKKGKWVFTNEFE